AEVDEIGEAVELGTEARRALEHACYPPVDAVKRGRKHDRRYRPFELVLEGKANRGEPGAQREQRDQVRQQRADRDASKTTQSCLGTFTLEGLKRHRPNITRC